MGDEPRTRSSEESERRRIIAALGETGYSLPGSIVERQMRCGRPGCRCHADPPALHGPYHQWSRKIDGKTVSRWLSGDQVERYRGWFANAKRVRDLLVELETLSLKIAERAEGWEPQAPPTGHRRRTGEGRSGPKTPRRASKR